MLQNYFKIGWRNLRKNKIYTLINILGLAVGLTFTLLIGSYVWEEWQVNADLRNIDNQYIIQSKWKQPNMGMDITTLAPIAKTLKEQYPNLIANYYRFDGIKTVVSKGDKHFREDIQLGDSTLLTMYGLPLLAGNPKTALTGPNSMVIPVQLAQKYFGRTDVLGESLTFDSFSGSRKEFMITGVLDKLPQNSVIDLIEDGTPILLSMSSMAFFGRGQFETWNNVYIVNYLELKEGVTKEDLKGPIAKTLATNAPEIIRDNVTIYLTPLREFYRQSNNGLIQKTILTLSVVAVFILLMAIVNFVNISIGSSTSRLKEIGVRKVLGSKKAQIIGQFLAESLLITFFSLIVSLIFYQVLRSFFGEILGKEIKSLFAFGPSFALILVLLAFVIGILAGAYPAFALSAFPSIDSMKGKLKSVKENVLFRRLLIVSQFAIALFVFGGAVVISQQVNYFFNKDLGYNKESMLWIPLPRDWSEAGIQKMETLRNEMARLPKVAAGSFAFEIPNGRTGFSTGLFKAGGDSTSAIAMNVLQTDERYAETYQIPMATGEFFYAKKGTFNPEQIVVNEATAKALGFKNAEAALGQKVRLQGIPQVFTIHGITKDFHFTSMHQTIQPLAFVHLRNTNVYRYLTLRLQPTNLSESLTILEKSWNRLAPGTPFEFTFLEDTLQKLYQSEVRLKKASQLATVLAIVIVLLGVVGMVSLSVGRRTKELGIRKVLGASGVSLVMLFLKEFLAVSAVAALISFPLVLMAMNQWLQNYAYRIEMSWLSFVGVGITFGVLIILLVGFQTFKATLMNPTQSLRSE
ncbi:ABC transporter permease [Runella sp.]|uniref:ABC transporter permease n=1 Tax=Runella sp. TaxID=1960881 RepID=UPI003D10998C